MLKNVGNEAERFALQHAILLSFLEDDDPDTLKHINLLLGSVICIRSLDSVPLISTSNGARVRLLYVRAHFILSKFHVSFESHDNDFSSRAPLAGIVTAFFDVF